MAPDIEFKVSGLPVLQSKFFDAQRKAKSSIGYEFISEMKKYIDTAPWSPLSAMQKTIREKKGLESRWEGNKPLSWYKKFIKYYANPSIDYHSQIASLGFPQKSHLKLGFLDGKRGEESFFLDYVLEYTESGGIVAVTKEMRRYLASLGVPIKKRTTSFNVPARPILFMLKKIKKNLADKAKEKLIEKLK